MPKFARFAAVVVLLATLVRAGNGQEQEESTVDSVKPWFLWSIGYSSPQQLTVSIGKAFEIADGWDLILQLEPGMGGGKIGVGLGQISYDFTFSSSGTSAWVLKASFLQTWGESINLPSVPLFSRGFVSTWGEPMDVESDIMHYGSYVGVEAKLMMGGPSVNAGAYKNLSAEAGEDWLFSGGVGFGF